MEKPGNIEARQKMFLAANYGGNAINTQLAGYVHAFAHSIGALYHIPHGKAIAFCMVPVVEEQKEICSRQLAELSVYCGFADTADEHAAEVFIDKLKELLSLCGLEKGCGMIKEPDYKKLVYMIDSDSVNYSPSKTFSDGEIRRLLDRIRKGE